MSKPASMRSTCSRYQENSEHSPLLSSSEPRSYNAVPAGSSGTPVQRQRWPSIVALSILCGAVISVLAVGFVVPAAAEQYAQQAVVLNISSLSIDSFTEKGVRIRVQADVGIDDNRVERWSTRTLGRIGGAVARNIHVNDFNLRVHLPDYGNALLGTAQIPPVAIDVRNGHSTNLDFISNTEPGPFGPVRLLLDDYLSGTLKSVKVLGEVEFKIRKGMFSMKPERMQREFILKDIPAVPTHRITHLHAEEAEVGSKKVIVANVSAAVENPYPLSFEVPALGFQVSLPGCEANSRVNAVTVASSPIVVKPEIGIVVDISGIIHSLPADLTAACPNTHLSPMDSFLGRFLHGEDAIVYVGGDGSNTDGRAPSWLVEILHSITVPIPFPGHTFDDVVQSFSLSHVNIKLPGFGDDATPLLSATVEAVIALPKEIDLTLNVTKLKALADVSYEHRAFGTLDIKQWIPVVSQRLPGERLMRVKGDFVDIPLNVTDYDTFQIVIRKLFFGGGKGVNLGIDGTTDADINTSLGKFIVRKIPASGNITLDGFPGLGSMPIPKLNDVVVKSTTEQSMNLVISLTAENPTPWEMVVPFVNLHVSRDGFVLGNGTVRDLFLKKGTNEIIVSAAWDPREYGGDEAEKAGEDLMGKYISGHNTSLTINTHEGSFPSMPLLGKALSTLRITVPTPRMGGSSHKDRPHFIESATMHVISSTADFLIKNPLPHNGIIIHTLGGAALFNGTTLGTINYTDNFIISPGRDGRTTTPRLPVDWSLDSVGYDAMWQALGGQLKVHTKAMCRLSIGSFHMKVFYNASDGVEAHVRL